jgi:hypothetical protein
MRIASVEMPLSDLYYQWAQNARNDPGREPGGLRRRWLVLHPVGWRLRPCMPSFSLSFEK